MTSAETYYAEKGEANILQDKMSRLFTQRMTYRIYILVSNAYDEMAVNAICNCLGKKG